MYSFNSTVRYSECDEHAQLGIVALINYLQDCSIFQSESLGLGINFMREHHFAWLLAAWEIEIEQLPRFQDPITISTWCYELKRTFALRNYLISDADGRPLVRADSFWFTFDSLSQRPIRVPDSEQPYLSGEPRLDMPPMKRKLAVDGPYREGAPILVGEQHLDTNRHVNNAQYVLMALQALGQDLAVHRICVQYCQQAHLGDSILPRIHEFSGGQTVELCDRAGSPYAIVMLED